MDGKKNILVFTDSMGNAGIQRVLSELTSSWVRKGHKITIAYIKKTENKENDFHWNQSIKFIEIPVKHNNILIYFDLFKEYIHILKQNPNSIAISLSVMTNFVLGACGPFVKNKIIISDRNDPTMRPKGRVKQFIRNLVFRQADTLVFQTEDVQKYYQKKIRRDGVIIPNPINPNLPEPYTGLRRQTIVTASRLNKQKNLGVLLKAFSYFSKDYPNYFLEIFGRGEEEENLKKLSRKLGIENKVKFKGFSNEIYNQIKDCAIYVCSSDYEGISNSLIEALGLGLPCISTDCPVGGSRLLIDNNENGILINVGDYKDLYVQMKKIVESPNLSEKLSKNAVKVRDRFNVDKIAQMWIDSM